MRLLLSIVLGCAVLFAATGCAKKAERTTATRVTNPKEEVPPPQPQQHAEVPAPPPSPEAAPAPAPKAVALKNGWFKLPSGVEYKDKKVGKGATAATGQRVTVHYKGWLDNGKVFDTSRKPDREPFSFQLGAGEVIPGWDQGVVGMKVGGTRELKIPAKLGYGEQGQGEIPPGATLHFDVELLQVGG